MEMLKPGLLDELRNFAIVEVRALDGQRP